MLVLFSDLHFTDETTAVNVKGSAFTNILGPEILDACRPGIKELNLVLLGDIYDLVRTDYWVQRPRDERPWNGKLDPSTAMNPLPSIEADFNRVLSAIFAKTAFFPTMLKNVFAGCGGVPTKVTYVVGNHDRVLNNFPSLRSAIEKEFGHPVSFVPSLAEPVYATCARHGHEWDENCSAFLLLKEVLQPDRIWDNKLDPAINTVMNIGEVITAELMGGLIFYVKQSDAALADILKDANNVRPLTNVITWLEWRSRTLAQNQKQLIADALIQAINGVIESNLGQLWDDTRQDIIVSGDITDYLEKVRNELQANGYAGLKGLAAIIVKLRGFLGFGAGDKCFQGAVQEFEQRLGADTKYLFYGHTHEARHDFLAGTGRRSKIYVNTGTYLPLIQAAYENHGFVQADQLTMAFVYRADEVDANEPQMDLWNGIRHSDGQT
jgi:UDP-2,3-diacylglucosamine pyrophosphatase LpxH